ncbi:hypothetical protein ANO14919_098440 [Xylariales sp. No.14919]|nr:hypothetical protein ANO14919_098440 [Xylariales sp. No.14919]
MPPSDDRPILRKGGGKTATLDPKVESYGPRNETTNINQQSLGLGVEPNEVNDITEQPAIEERSDGVGKSTLEPKSDRARIRSTIPP